MSICIKHYEIDGNYLIDHKRKEIVTLTDEERDELIKKFANYDDAQTNRNYLQ